MDVIFIGKFFPRDLLSTIGFDSKGLIGMSNHNFEMSIIDGLCHQEDINLKCITCPGVFSYPYNNRRLFTRAERYDFRDTHIESAAFCNIVGLKELLSTLSTARILFNTIEAFSESTIHLIINTPDLGLFSAIKMVENKTTKHLTKTVIIPDIPAMITSMDKHNMFKRCILSKINEKEMMFTSKCNGLVVLTEAMMEFIPIQVPHIVMEGLVDVTSMDKSDVEQITNKKVIMYTGTLRKIFGVQNLVKAFQMVVDNDAELWICGGGDSEDYIKQAAKNDSRIKFFGLVDSKTALELQHKATILVNPRTSEGEFTKYSFPSKTLEYLLAGKSVVANRLPGIPEEYFKYIYTPSDESVEAFADCLSAVLRLNSQERDARAEAGRKFVIDNKNSKFQISRILDLIKTY